LRFGGIEVKRIWKTQSKRKTMRHSNNMQVIYLDNVRLTAEFTENAEDVGCLEV